MATPGLWSWITVESVPVGQVQESVPISPHVCHGEVIEPTPSVPSSDHFDTRRFVHIRAHYRVKMFIDHWRVGKGDFVLAFGTEQ